MCGGCRGRRRGSEAGAAAGGGSCGAALAVAVLAAAAVVAFLEGTAGGVAYAGDRWFHDCAKWDAESGRFLVSTFFGSGVAVVRAGGERKEEERVVVADPDAAGRVALGLAVDAPRRRVLVVYTDRPPWFGYAAVGAYELGSWRRLFLTRLDGPGMPVHHPPQASTLVGGGAGDALLSTEEKLTTGEMVVVLRTVEREMEMEDTARVSLVGVITMVREPTMMRRVAKVSLL